MQVRVCAARVLDIVRLNRLREWLQQRHSLGAAWGAVGDVTLTPALAAELRRLQKGGRKWHR